VSSGFASPVFFHLEPNFVAHTEIGADASIVGIWEGSNNGSPLVVRSETGTGGGGRDDNGAVHRDFVAEGLADKTLHRTRQVTKHNQTTVPIKHDVSIGVAAEVTANSPRTA